MAVTSEIVFHSGVVGEVAGVGDEANVEGGGGQTLLVSVVGDGVLVGVAGAVVGLRRVADDAGHGAENNEEIEIPRHVGVEVPCACDLGPRGRRPFVNGHVLEYRVLSLY